MDFKVTAVETLSIHNHEFAIIGFDITGPVTAAIRPDRGVDASTWNRLAAAAASNCTAVCDWCPPGGSMDIHVCNGTVTFNIDNDSDGCGGTATISVAAPACVDAFRSAADMATEWTLIYHCNAARKYIEANPVPTTLPGLSVLVWKHLHDESYVRGVLDAIGYITTTCRRSMLNNIRVTGANLSIRYLVSRYLAYIAQK